MSNFYYQVESDFHSEAAQFDTKREAVKYAKTLQHAEVYRWLYDEVEDEELVWVTGD